MGCCGHRRTMQNLQGSGTPRVLPITSSASAGSLQSSIAVRYLGHETMVVRGPISGRVYTFSRLKPGQSVDAGDAVVFLRNRLFRQA